ncbi:propionate catabolism operon regulatory protein PrpR [Ramlibacter sp. G-1-2-2]|uniref:Propionate catabolism operon regulatory protein PrpR n=1 Tax=Ramlibacter agri TaxID=2728837 RepID=A0A848GYJ4_9BURK|nr:propionate catabolism operon regulatory protein PrpR [Ramlibacter agri]NML42362.1 propionate catabolism operon regulatory protein PrpR [Ramlibacter agri]
MKHSDDAPVRLCFLSYRHLSELASSVFDEFAGRAEIEVVEASFQPAVSAARAREQAGTVDAFVSAGSNAALLREALSAPVATIQVNGYDILLALLRARQHGERVGVVTFGGIIAELDRVKQLLNIDVAQRAYRTADEARACFRAFAAEGRQVIVGSSIVVEMAEQEGLHGILAYSAASVRQGIEDAIEMGRLARLEASRHQQVHALLHNLQEAVLATDAAHRITAINATMQKLLGAPLAAVQGRDLRDVAPDLSLLETLQRGEEERGLVLQFGGRDWIASRTPLRQSGQVTGAVLALYDGRAIEEADTSLRTQRRRRRQGGVRYSFADLQGASPAFQRAVQAARRFAGTDLSVLVTGESGTGKELFAQAIHGASVRASRPFVALNCSALPEALLESELFGYEEGAFTGSRRGGKPGLFEAAHTGTVFLDEIGDMPLPLQTRLLRVLQEREVTRLGSTTPIPVDVRIIAATHQPLRSMIAQRSFRADLFYRLNLLQLALPSLREREGDIELLALGALHRRLAQLQSPLDAREVLARVRPMLAAYAWPGNVRELENVCDRIAVFFAQYERVTQVPLEVLGFDCPELGATPVSAGPSAAEVLAACGGHRGRAAEQLGISRATLWRRLKSGPAVS